MISADTGSPARAMGGVGYLTGLTRWLSVPDLLGWWCLGRLTLWTWPGCHPQPCLLGSNAKRAGGSRLVGGRCGEGKPEGSGSKGWSMGVGIGIRQVMVALRAPHNKTGKLQ